MYRQCSNDVDIAKMMGHLRNTAKNVIYDIAAASYDNDVD